MKSKTKNVNGYKGIFYSLHVKLIVLVIVALAPVLGTILHSVAEQRRIAIVEEEKGDVLTQIKKLCGIKEAK